MVARYALWLEHEAFTNRQTSNHMVLESWRFELSITGKLMWVRAWAEPRLIAVKTRNGWQMSASIVPMSLVNQAISALVKA